MNLLSDYDSVIERCSRSVSKVPPRTGVAQVDALHEGWPRPLWLITGPALAGRTVLATQMARIAAVQDGKATGLVSLREDGDEILGRLLSAMSLVPLHHLRTARLSDVQRTELRGAIEALRTARLSVVAASGMSAVSRVDMVLDGCRELDLLIVDDVDLWDDPMLSLLPRLRAWAKETDTVVVVTAPEESAAVTRLWGRHCDMIVRLRPSAVLGEVGLEQMTIEVVGPAGDPMGASVVELQAHLSRIISGPELPVVGTSPAAAAS